MFDLETLTYGLTLTVVPFGIIFTVAAIWWALADTSLRKLPAAERLRWTLLVILIPPVGWLLYNLRNREREEEMADPAAEA